MIRIWASSGLATEQRHVPGKFLVFLNNDTVVTTGWLDAHADLPRYARYRVGRC